MENNKRKSNSSNQCYRSLSLSKPAYLEQEDLHSRLLQVCFYICYQWHVFLGT